MSNHENDMFITAHNGTLSTVEGAGATLSSTCGNSSVEEEKTPGFGSTTDYRQNNGENDEILGSRISSNSNANIYSHHCPFDHDQLLCWPPTEVGDTASLRCMKWFNAIVYSGNATRTCGPGGVWEKSDYSLCQHMNTTLLNANNSENPVVDLEVEGVYLFGYSLSLAALIFAAVIFISFKELRCLRNTIHSHLIITYILADALWVISHICIVHVKIGKHSDRMKCLTFILLHYFILTNFFWMFVEGLYLYVLVVQTFMAESIKLRTYCILGWGIPFMVVMLWCIIRWITMTDLPEFYEPNSVITPISVRDIENQDFVSCPWLHVHVYDWIYKISALVVLAANMLFLLQIMWVLITKLRSATTPETQQSRKAAKALVVLMPLLGITYVLILIGPRKVPIYEYMRAFLISTQGFLVALFYCFLNQEVRLALRHRWSRIRNLGPDCACCGCETELERRQNNQNLRDWSPRSRTESIRLYTPTSHTFRKRESSASETTTMTAVLGSFNGGGAGHGQSIIMTTNTGRRYSTTPISCKSSNLTVNEDTAFI